MILAAAGLSAAAALWPVLHARIERPVGAPAVAVGLGDLEQAGGIEGTFPPPPAANPLPRTERGSGPESAAQALVRLRSPALRGDAQAAWKAFRIAQLCETPDRNRAALRTLPVGMFAMLRPALQPEAELIANLCEGITPTQLRERRAYLLIAADGGVPGAAAELFDLGPSDGADEDPSDPDAKAWGAHALALLQRDAARGDIGALTALETVYQYGGLAPADATQALTYQLVVQQLMAADAEMYAPAELDLQREAATLIASQLPESQRLISQRAAAGLVAGCGPRCAH